MGILVFLLILSILILVHEFGHFIVAKKSGVMVEEFGLGFPPRLFSIKKGETVYSINLFPIGGFVKVFGEEYHEKDKSNIELYKLLKDKAFIYKRPWQKALIVIAGVIGNILLAWILLSFLATQGIQVPTNQVRIQQVQNNSPAQEVGLKKGEIIKKIKISNREIVLTNPEELIRVSNENPDEVLLLTITDTKGIERDVAITARKNPPKNQGPLGISISASKTQKYSILQAPLIGIKLTISYLTAILVGFGQLFKSLLSFQKPAFDVAGPIGIAQFTGQALQFGYLALIEFTAVLSLNLAVLNIVPFPALDGGRLSFVIYEWITNKRINKNFEKAANAFGMLILLSLIVIITVNDIIRIFK